MTPSRARIDVPREQIAELCRHRHIRRLAFFGSVEPGTRVGFAFFGIERELSEILGRRVDLRTAQELSKYFRDEVMAEAEEVYVAA